MHPEILVTGGSGMVGTYLIRWLLDHGFDRITATYQGDDPAGIPEWSRSRVTWQSMRLPDLERVNTLVQGKTWVIHAAALVSYLRRDRYRLLKINRLGTEQLVNASLHHGVSHFIYIGSIASLGKEIPGPVMDEQTPWLDNSLATPYGLSKYLGELEAWRAAAEDLPVSVVLPAVILGTGPWQRSSLQLIRQILSGPPWYPGGETGFVDVRDVVEFTGRLLSATPGDRWLLSGGQLTYETLYTTLGGALRPSATYRPAPEKLVRWVYAYARAVAGKAVSPELIHQLYAPLRYSANKSLTMPDFTYRPLADTMSDMVAVLRNDPASLLRFD